ncbi:hypothetical protein AGLY_004915 [Aphis glycines]|uniref:Glucose-methanol-choline oxidoreductase N-terminal domain-containing protein n=1 Tax=Aphis glycines TaxID=307491 RepID=A0A6G0TXN0_APHGL|nr:hypothetical protein AGLY_004915 [Aphis glycines]
MNTKTIVVTVFYMVLQGYHAIIYPSDYACTLCEDPTQVTFNFIVVGGGSAGATVAARLSEIPEWNVLLLEAGDDPPELTENPLLWNHNLRTKYDWTFFSEKNPLLFKGMEDERCIISRGLMLGGSSSINAMIYLRGTVEDFRQWKNKYGCYGWDYEDVLPYFKKSEDFVDLSRFDPDVHSVGGMLTVTPLTTFDPAYTVIAEAEQSIHLIEVNDLNRKGPVIGYGNFDSTTRNGRRCSTLKAFLMPVSNRSNLYVAKNTIVTKIIIVDGVAVGVEFKCSSGEFKSVFCTNEVVLCAGPIKSPQLLMLSGIGPREHLNEHGIHVINDLPVGLNVQDHMSLPALVFTDRKCRPIEDIKKESSDLLKKEISLYSKNISTLGLNAGLVLEELKLPNCADYVWDTRDYWICAIQNLAAPFYHVVGSCRMGPEDDPFTVVDPKLRVKGIIGLRLIDSSIMPKIVSVNTNAAAIMIGEKGSDIIKECYGKL